MYGLLLHIPETTAFSLRLLAIGFIVVLPFLMMNREQITRARLALVLTLAALLLVPVTVWATVEIANPCESWEDLEATFGWALAWWYWISYGC